MFVRSNVTTNNTRAFMNAGIFRNHHSATAAAALLAALLLWAGALPSRAIDNGRKGLTFDETIYDFGKFSEDSGPKTCTFRYTNRSDVAILIYEVTASCGCTNTVWSKKPVKPGESGEIKVTFDNKSGAFEMDKTVTVYMSSAIRPAILRIKGTVTPAKKK